MLNNLILSAFAKIIRVLLKSPGILATISPGRLQEGGLACPL